MTHDKQQILIRPASSCSKDSTILVDLGWRTFDDTFSPFTPRPDMDLFLNANYTTDIFEKDIASRENEYFIAEVNGQPAAFLKMSRQEEYIPPCVTGPELIELAKLYVDVPFKRMGLGTVLMNTAMEVAKRHQSKTMWLGVWEHNEPAKTFYTGWGFTLVGSHPYPVGNDPQTDLLMTKTLDL